MGTKVKFTATSDFKQYNGDVNFKNGEVKEISITLAERLLSDFPKQFSLVEESTPAKTELAEGRRK